MNAPVVLCIDFVTYADAVAALKVLADELPNRKEQRERLLTAAADLERAHAVYTLINSRAAPSDNLPALLKPQI